MSALRAKRQIIAFGEEPLEAGRGFCRLPGHITLVPWFQGANQEKLDKGLVQVASRFAPMEAQLEQPDNFGPEKDIEGWLLKPLPKLVSLHNLASAEVHRAGGVFEGVDNLSYRYKPHFIEGVQPVNEAYSLGSFALLEQSGRWLEVRQTYELSR